LALQTVEALVGGREPLVQLVEKQLGFRVHGAALSIQSGVVAVGEGGIGSIQNCNPPQIELSGEGNYEIPKQNCSSQIAMG
jgi:hypothetical protein